MIIDSVEVWPISQVVRRDVAIVSAAGAQPESHFAVVAIQTKDGLTGYGEASVVPGWSGETQQTAIHHIEALLTPLLIGEDARRIAWLTDKMDRHLIGNPFTKCAVEMALVDVVSKGLGVPALTLMGGARRPPEIALRFSIGVFPPAQAADVAMKALALGLKAVKVKVGLHTPTDLARVQAVREAVGPNVRVAVDANGGWRESDVLEAIPHLERLEVNALEQPLRRGDFRGCARLRQRTRIPLMLDESVFTRQDALEAIRQEACDIISIYPGKNGGMLRSLEIAQMASAAGLQCTIGSNLEMDLGTAAMLQVAIAASALSETVEHDIIGPLYYDLHPVSHPIEFRNGCAVASERPGLGLEPDFTRMEVVAAR